MCLANISNWITIFFELFCSVSSFIKALSRNFPASNPPTVPWFVSRRRWIICWHNGKEKKQKMEKPATGKPAYWRHFPLPSYSKSSCGSASVFRIRILFRSYVKCCGAGAGWAGSGLFFNNLRINKWWQKFVCLTWWVIFFLVLRFVKTIFFNNMHDINI